MNEKKILKSLYETIPLGKYKNKQVRTVLEQDPKYIVNLVSKKFGFSDGISEMAYEKVNDTEDDE